MPSPQILAKRAARRLPEPQRALIRRVAHRIPAVPPRYFWPWVLPGAPALHEARWRLRLARAATMTSEQHAAIAGLSEIEEPIGCSLCGETRMQPLFRPVDPKSGRWSYRVVRCPSCTFLYRHPGIRPERLGDLYAGRYDKFLTGKYAAKRQRRYRIVMDAFAPVFTDGTGRRLFDFGSGTGLFLETAHQRGFDGYGVDLSPDSVEAAHQRPGGAKTWFGAPGDVPEIAAGGFDVVTMWSVLAHLTTPVEDLRMLRGLLASDGLLLIMTVNANSMELKEKGERWSGFNKNHLKFFSPTTLPVLLRQAGFGAVVFRPTYGDGVESGNTALAPMWQRRLRRVVDRTNNGNMLRAIAFADPEGPARWGLEADALRL